MNNSKQKIVLYLTMIFLAGGIAGAAIGWNKGGQHEKRAPMQGRPDSKKMCDFMKKRLQERVGLSVEQVTSVEPILKKSCREIEQIHERSIAEVEDSIRRAHGAIATNLTAEQRAKLDQFEQERREFWRKRFGKKDHHKGEKEKDLKSGENPHRGDH